MEEEEEEEVRLGDYAGLVAKAVLAETMAERIWSIPCSADCHRTHNTTTTGAGYTPLTVHAEFNLCCTLLSAGFVNSDLRWNFSGGGGSAWGWRSCTFPFGRVKVSVALT